MKITGVTDNLLKMLIILSAQRETKNEGLLRFLNDHNPVFLFVFFYVGKTAPNIFYILKVMLYQQTMEQLVFHRQ